MLLNLAAMDAQVCKSENGFVCEKTTRLAFMQP
jgi:hypothetical protein